MKKKLIRMSLLLATLLISFASCSKLDIEEDQIVGRWQTSKYIYQFNEDYSGYRTPRDFQEDYPLTWDLNVDELELRITGVGESSIVVYETWVITSISDSRMEAYDCDDPDETTVTFNRI